MTRKILATLVAVLLTAGAAVAQEFSRSHQVHVRLGYNIGGTAPLGLPASIRHLNSYTIMGNPAAGADVLWPFDGWRGLLVGLRFERKSMREDANVKNYHMEIVRGGERLSGMFTGDVTTRSSQWMLTLPVQAVWRARRVNIKVGPYASWVLGKQFDGWAHNGYLRVDDPTGAKVELGQARDERGDYDFGDHLRYWQVGLGLGADWNPGGRLGLYAELNWGLSPIFSLDFNTVEQNLYPIYGQLGLTYRLK